MLRVAEHFEQSDTGRQRRANEDHFLVRAPLFLVADGMGGAQAGEVASGIAAETFADGLPPEGSPEERLAARVLDANRRIFELSQRDHERAGMGTTLTAAYVDAAGVAIAHVGDSRAYLLRDGELTRLTRDHSLVDELVRRGKLTEEEAAEHPQRSIITRALGPEPEVEVDTLTQPARDGDVVLLCSDGLTSMISEGEVGEILREARSLRDAGEALVAAANEAGGRDNITVVLFRLAEASGAAGAAGDALDVRGEDGARPSASGVARLRRNTPPSETAHRLDERGGRTGGDPGSRRTGADVQDGRTGGDPRDRRAGVDERGGRTGGDPAARAPLPRRVKALAAVAATIVVLGGLGVAGWLASRAVFFLGTNGSGMVTVYRGVPWDLPAGIHLYETWYVSGVPASTVPPARRSSLLDHRLRSQRDASGLVSQLELGTLAP